MHFNFYRFLWLRWAFGLSLAAVFALVGYMYYLAANQPPTRLTVVISTSPTASPAEWFVENPEAGFIEPYLGPLVVLFTIFAFVASLRLSRMKETRNMIEQTMRLLEELGVGTTGRESMDFHGLAQYEVFQSSDRMTVRATVPESREGFVLNVTVSNGHHRTIPPYCLVVTRWRVTLGMDTGVVLPFRDRHYLDRPLQLMKDEMSLRQQIDKLDFGGLRLPK